MTTKRYPRTLTEAFGPYQEHGLVEQYDPMPVADRIVVAIGAVGFIAVIALIGLGVI